MINRLLEQQGTNSTADIVKVIAMKWMCKIWKVLTVCIVSLFLIAVSSVSSSSSIIRDAHAILKSHIRDNYPWKNIEIRDIRVTGELNEEIPEKIVVEKGPLGKAVFLLYSKKGDRVIVRANITAYGRIVMSKRSFRKGHIIGEDDVYVVKKDISKMPKGSLTGIDMIIGKSLKRSIAANIPVVENMIHTHQPVRRGKIVKLLIGNEDFSISATGKTKEKGYVGKSVRAVNLSSKKVVTGVLVDERTVRVGL
ncbi:MAG: flagellar basal body P-ring formation protein FlgA [Nitrospiraceae bacterium]|nr:MAG: flagellar basal body P-ring formation protein FlgA [Nitrospiraceae bacterium]